MGTLVAIGIYRSMHDNDFMAKSEEYWTREREKDKKIEAAHAEFERFD